MNDETTTNILIDGFAKEAKVTKQNYVETRPIEVTFYHIHDLLNEAMFFKRRFEDARNLRAVPGQRKSNSIAFKITEFLGAILAWKLLNEAQKRTPETPMAISQTLLSSDIRTLAQSLHDVQAVPSELRDIIGRSLVLHSALIENEETP